MSASTSSVSFLRRGGDLITLMDDFKSGPLFSEVLDRVEVGVFL